MTKRGDTNPHGILEERLVDRRRFLARVSSVGLLVFRGGAALAMLLGWSGAAAADTTPARSVHMVCLGDSIMWGQGLDPEQKFQSIVASWVQTTAHRQVRRWNFAHSGAGFGPNPRTVIGRPTAASIGRQANATGVDPSTVPDIEVLRERGPKPTVATAQETSTGDKLGGEIPRTSPTLWRQLNLALETLRTGRDARGGLPDMSMAGPPVDPKDVDLVLMDGGANDVGFLDIVIDSSRSAEQVRQRTRETIGAGIKAFLPDLLKAFPNATVVVTGYYKGLSAMSAHAQALELLQQAARWYPQLNPLNLLPPDAVPRAIERMAAFDDTANAVLQEAVTQLGQGRTRFVSSGFEPQNAYGAPQRLVFHYTDTDPAERVRRPECDRLLAEWLQGSSSADSAYYLYCIDASTFHPNPVGAQRYAQRIIAALQDLHPAWLAAPVVAAAKAVRLDVKGTTAGATKTVVVTAVDASTGQPLAGTVTIAGVTGQTGTPVSYPAACGAAADAELPTGPKGVVRRPPVHAPCTGKVEVQGYSPSAFRY